MKKVTKIDETYHQKSSCQKLRVAAYCRISTAKDAQLESLEIQMLHYENYIQSRSNWELAGLYFDEGITGTKKDKRPELKRMLQDCEMGKIDLILTKSISRFCRNTADCLKLVRKLLSLQIPIYFEKENLNTGSMESELFLSVLSSMAESESESVSKNLKWSIQKQFENGTFKISYPPYGYDWDGEKLTINKDQAIIVRDIFSKILSGKSATTIANELNERGLTPKRGNKWRSSSILSMVGNEKYAGDCLFQKTYSDSAFKRHRNKGEKSQYLVSEHHEAIISRETLQAAQAIVRQHGKEKGSDKRIGKCQNRYAFSGKIICGECGSLFKRRVHYSTRSKYTAWTCSTHIEDKNKCSMLFIRDNQLKLAFVTMMNKLVFSHRALLKPYVDALKNSPANNSFHRIQEIQTKLAENAEKRETLYKLMAQGIIDQVLYNQENNTLLSVYGKTKRELESLMKNISGNASFFSAANDLLHFARKGVMLDDFDDELFLQHVNRIVVLSRHEVRFDLKCGLTLKERI